MHWIYILLIAIILCGVGALALILMGKIVTQLRVPISADAYITQDPENVNWGQEKTLNVYGGVTDAIGWQHDQMFSWLRADMTPYTGGEIVDAELHLYITEDCDSAGTVVVHFSSHDDWKEGTVDCSGSDKCTDVITWKHMPAFDIIGELDSKKISSSDTNTWITLNITSKVIDELATGNKIISLVLTQQGDSVSCFASRETDHQPYVTLAHR